MTTEEPIQGLWVGQELSTMQRLSIQSFITNGHPYHLYVYEDVANVPEQTIIKNANDIIPQARVFKNAKRDTYAAFSDLFRYKLLTSVGGWWADTDTVCLKPFDFADPYVFSSEHSLGDPTSRRIDLGAPFVETPNGGVIKSPRNAPIFLEAWNISSAKDASTLTWSEVGPALLRELLPKHSLSSYVRKAVTFCPVPYFAFTSVVDPKWSFDVAPDVYAIHLWNELWRRKNLDPDAQYHDDCLYARLQKLYL